MHITKSFSAIISLSLALAQSISVQAAPKDDKGRDIEQKSGFHQSFYIGASAGIPSGFSTFSSFAQDGFHAGFAGDIFAGYRFNSILSAEADFGWGRTIMGARSCCSDSYWIGEDWNTYYGSVLGMGGWYRRDVRIVGSTQRYGARLNLDILGFFDRTKDGRWHLELTPQTFLYGTKSRLVPTTGSGTLLSSPNRWHFGYGAALQAGYDITRSLRLGIACGMTFLTGKNMDGFSGRGIHDGNSIMEAAIRISWDFPVTCRRSNVSAGTVRTESGWTDTPLVKPTTETAGTENKDTETTAAAADTEQISSKFKLKTSDESVNTEVQHPVSDENVQAVPAEEELAEPVSIFFDKSSWTITAQETGKLQQAAAYLTTHPEVSAEVTGWCDKYGTDEVNATISEFRARVVKKWLVKAGIEAGRISTSGNGVDLDEHDRSIARRASIVFKISEQ